jgi:hypothetical protein
VHQRAALQVNGEYCRLRTGHYTVEICPVS